MSRRLCCQSRGRSSWSDERRRDVFSSLFRMKRQFDPAEPELMDLPQPVTTELEVDLQNLRQLNRFFGGHALVSRFLRDWIQTGQSLARARPCHGLRRCSSSGCRSCAKHWREGGSGSGGSTDFHARDRSTIKRGLSRRSLIMQGNILEWGNDDAYDIVLCTLASAPFQRGRRRALAAALPQTFARLRFGFRSAPGISCHDRQLIFSPPSFFARR